MLIFALRFLWFSFGLLKSASTYFRKGELTYDLTAGIAVFLVALPLCLGIALASGAPPYAGLLSGMIGGIVVGFLSGSSLAVSGPAAGLSTVVAAALVSMPDYHTFMLSVVVAGLFQLLLGLFRLGIFANYFPSSVIKGMLAAIGILLLSKQIPIALGYDSPDFWQSGFLHLFDSGGFVNQLTQLNQHFGRGAIIITIVSLAILLLWQHPAAKKLKIIPAPLVVVLIGIALNKSFTHFNGPALLPGQLVQINSSIFREISFAPITDIFSSGDIWKTGIIIGVLASLETLLCIEAMDKLDRRNRITPINRELMAQGSGNVLCGLVGALPITAVVVRGAANVDAGARTKLSSITHGVLLLLAVILIPQWLSEIPFACLAAILIVTGYNLASHKLFGNMWKLGAKQFLPFALTIGVILATDMLIGVSIGLLLSIYFIVQNNFKAEYKISHSAEHGSEIYVIRLNTNVTFLNKVKLRNALDKVPASSHLLIDGSHCNFIDYDILEVISAFEPKARERNIELTLKGIEKVNVVAIH